MPERKASTRRIVGSCSLFALLGLSLAAEARSAFTRSFELSAQKYQGLWYELGRTPNDFEDDLPKLQGEKFGPCLDATASYSALADGRLSVHNVCVRESIDNPDHEVNDSVSGVAQIEAGSDNRKLKVAFGSKFARFFQRLFTGGGADYWVYGVGPDNAEGVYSWALVSGSKRDNIFILAREKSLPGEQIQEILELARREALPTEALIFTQR